MGKSKLALHEGSGWKAPSTGETGHLFTDYVRSLDGRGEPPSEDALRELLTALRGALVRELQRRGLWGSPPTFLGVYGYDRWSGDRSEGDALEELTAACYTFNFVERLRALRSQLKVKPNIEGLVFLNIRNFLHERQRQHDPLGYHLFGVLRTAVREAIAAGTLTVAAGNDKVRNDTVLAAGTSPALVSPTGDRSPGDVATLLSRTVSAWCSELLPDLVTARGRRQEQVVSSLARRLADLQREGLASWGFKDLMDALKREVRTRWADLFERASGEAGVEPGQEALGNVVQLYRSEEAADQRLEARQSFRALTVCVARALERLVTRERTRQYLSDLWEFLRLHVTWPGEEVSADSAPARAAAAAGERLPSQRRLAELLQIPRDRLPELFATLGEILQECRAANSGNASVTSMRGRLAAAPRPGEHHD